jgi:uncharacterized protein YjbI with pentapeptide repeats
MTTKLTQQELNRVIDDHHLWLECQPGGKKATFHRLDLSGLDFQNKDLRHAIFRGSDLSGTNFCGANLHNADLSRTNLNGADFSNTNIRYADLRYSKLIGVNLSDANMYGSNLTYVDLTNANLHNTDLSNTDIRGVELTGANLIVLSLPIWSVYIHKETIRVGAQHHSHEAWLGFSDEEIREMHPHALTWWKSHKMLIVAGIEYIKAQSANAK